MAITYKPVTLPPAGIARGITLAAPALVGGTRRADPVAAREID